MKKKQNNPNGKDLTSYVYAVKNKNNDIEGFIEGEYGDVMDSTASIIIALSRDSNRPETDIIKDVKKSVQRINNGRNKK